MNGPDPVYGDGQLYVVLSHAKPWLSVLVPIIGVTET